MVPIHVSQWEKIIKIKYVIVAWLIITNMKSSYIVGLFVTAGVRTVDVQAVEGMVAQFPCDLGTAANDKVYMVFWFRDDAGIPLYRYVLQLQSIS